MHERFNRASSTQTSFSSIKNFLQCGRFELNFCQQLYSQKRWFLKSSCQVRHGMLVGFARDVGKRRKRRKKKEEKRRKKKEEKRRREKKKKIIGWEKKEERRKKKEKTKNINRENSPIVPVLQRSLVQVQKMLVSRLVYRHAFWILNHIQRLVDDG